MVPARTSQRADSVAGEMLSTVLLPPALIPSTLNVLLRGTSPRDFLLITVEIVQTLRSESSLSDEEEGSSDEEDGVEAMLRGTPRKLGTKDRGEKQLVDDGGRRRESDLRCLSIVRALLERVMGVCLPPLWSSDR